MVMFACKVASNFLRLTNNWQSQRVVARFTALVLLVALAICAVPSPVAAAALRDAVRGWTALALQIGNTFGKLRGVPASPANRGMPPTQENGRGIHPSPPPSREEKEARVASLALNPSDDVVLQSQQPMLFTAVPVDADDNAIHGLFAEWQSNNSQVVSVNDNGEAVAGRPGTAILTASAGNVRKNVRVTVIEGSGEPFGGKKKENSRRAKRNAAIVSPPVSQPKVAKKSEGKRERSHSLSRSLTSSLPFLRAPNDDPLPDDETGSLFLPRNSIGAPTGRTIAAPVTPPVATEGTELPGSGNFSFALPVVNLPGRGIDVALNLTYNSRVFNSSVDPFDGTTFMTYDVDSGWPAVGFRLGFGQIEDQGSFGFTLTDGDGTRHALRFTSTNNYDTDDGTFIHFTGGSGWGSAYFSDGTRVDYGAAGGGFRSYPTKIVDRNGNYLLISYLNGVGPKISTVQDTLGRFVRFYYASNGDLVAITAPGLTGQSDRQIMRFYYQDLTLNTSGLFNSSIGINAPASTRVIKYIYLPSDTESGNAHLGYRYDYSAYGMIYQTAKLHGMTVSSTALDQTGSVSTEGTQAALTTYNYPTTASALSDVPAYTRRTDEWAGRTTGMPTTGEAPYFTFAVDQANGITTVTSPDNTVTESHSIVAPGQWNDGFVNQTITRQGAGGPILSEMDMDWERDANSKNPRPHQFLVKNDAQQAITIVITYSTYNNVTVSSIRGFDGVEVRRVETDYETSAAWINRRLLHLPTSRRVYAGGATSPSARTDYVYDTNGSNLVARNDITMHETAFDPFAASGYDSATDKRGNVTSVISYADAANGTSSITRATTRDIAGNVVTVQLGCCQQQSFGYSNTFSYAYPTSLTVGSGPTLTTSVGYDFNTGLVSTSTDENGQITSAFYFGDSLRPDHVDAPDGGSVTYHYNETLTADAASRLHFYASTTIKLDATRSMDSYRFFDGRGAVTQTFDKWTQANGWATQDTEYDPLGRPYRVSNPYYTPGYGSAGINPSGLWTTRTYDGLSRLTRVDMPSGDAQNPTATFATNEYSGVFRTITDQAGKKRRQKSDALGRLIRVDEPDQTGSLGTTDSPAQSTSYEYDALDNLIHIAQGSQHRYFRYDSLSRMTHERQVEQDTPYTTTDYVAGNNQWSRKSEYNSQGLEENSYDARQIRTHFLYDGINRLTQIEYFLQNGSADPATPPVFYYYDAQTLPNNAPAFDRGYSLGHVVAMTYGSNTALTGNYYGYDKMGRVKTQRQVTGTTTYTLNYTYNLAGQLITETYPTNRTLTYDYDEAGMLSQVREGSSVYASGFAYAPHGGLSSETFGNGAVHSMLYNRALQTSEIKLKQSATGAELQRFNYLYGSVNQTNGSVDTTKNVGQIGQTSNYIDGVKQWDQRFSYDSMARLEIAAEYRGDNAQQSWQTQYTYDRFGNRFQSGTGNSGVSYTPVVLSEIDAARNRFNTTGATAISYDPAGNITADLKFRGMNYQYDANGRQTFSRREDTTNQQTSVYDCSGRRVQTSVNGATRQIVYDAFGQNVAEYLNGALERENVFRNDQLFMVIDAPPAAASVPSGLTSTAGASVTLNWTAAAGATNYRVTRATSKNGPYSFVGTTSATSYNDTSVTSGTAYLYRICAADGQGNCTSGYSNITLGVAFSFTDPTITSFSENPSNATVVKAAHITELRTVVNAVRNLAGLSNATWTNGNIVPGVTVVSKDDVQDLRDRLNDALVAMNLQTSPYSDSTLTAGANGTPIKAVHIRELRQRATSSTGSSCFKLVSQFVQDFYQGALGRQPSASELSQWTATLMQAQMQGSNQLLGAAQSLGAVLFTSAEYTSPPKDNPSYITDLYEGYLQRAPDPDGYAHWLGDLNNGASRATLRNAFASSPEFYDKATALCANVGGTSSGVRYLISDTRGSIRTVMNNSGAGTSTVVARHDYLPFGEEVWAGTGMRTGGQGYGTADGIRSKFGLMERDDASGLDHTWWRKYDNMSGRWTSPDPTIASMVTNDPQSFNRYSYVQNDPANLLDPTGLFWMIDLASCQTVAYITIHFDTPQQQTFELQVCGVIWVGPTGRGDEPGGPRGGGINRHHGLHAPPKCKVDPLTEVTDPDAYYLEDSGGTILLTDGLTQGTQQALNCFEAGIVGTGGTFNLHSAYRPDAYQKHLAEVYEKWQKLQNNKQPECASTKAAVKAEMDKHHISEAPCTGNGCPHVAGIAFDATVRLGPRAPRGVTRNTIMRGCGVSQPRNNPEGEHHYEHR
jgi:RHS repeat-associated protein